MTEILKAGDRLEFVAVLAPGCEDGFFRVGEYPEVERYHKVQEILVVNVAGGAGWARWAEVRFEGDRPSDFINLAHVCWCRMEEERDGVPWPDPDPSTHAGAALLDRGVP